MSNTALVRRSGSYEDAYPSVMKRYTYEDAERETGDLYHSKSDELVLQASYVPDISESSTEKLDLPSRNSVLLTAYHSDGELDETEDRSVHKMIGHFENESTRRRSRYISATERVDPEYSVRDIVSENDFYKFVLFKNHYEKYMDISKKYDEVRSMAYYLEEKYHEVKAQRDSLIESNKELEQRLEVKNVQLHEKEDEAFQHLERIFRLEEDCEKLRREKDKIVELKDQLQKEKNEIYKQLRLHTENSEVRRHNFEKAKNDIVKQLNEIAKEKDCLEKENTELKDVVGDLERRIPHASRTRNNSKRQSTLKLEKQVSELKAVAKQSATLNSQLKKGMRHLATCKRRKCSVCAYTKSTFGNYSSDDRSRGKLTGCFPFHESKRGSPSDERLAERMSQCSLSPYLPYTPAAMSHASYMDDESSDSDEAPTCAHPFSSDSGISSEMCEGVDAIRRTKWTTSFRKLIRRVSYKK